MATEIVIIAAPIVAVFLIIVLLVVFYKKTSTKKDIPTHHPSAGAMEGIMIETTKRQTIHGGTVVVHSPPVIDRAQKFRERARSVSIGRPEFKLSKKRAASSKNIYQTLGNHPDFEALCKEDLAPRRTSEDTTSHNSDPDTPKGANYDDYLNNQSISDTGPTFNSAAAEIV